jgi:glutamate formiminotransferase
MRRLLRTMTASSSAMSTCSEASYVACNIYISSASSTNSTTLQNLLKAAQDHCRSIREKASSAAKPKCSGISNSNQDDHFLHKEESSVAVIHAFADVPYNRSSFHLAGRADCVADVALHLILNSFDQIDFDSKGQSANAHPFVGLVDHVSVMPMVTYHVEPSKSVMLDIKRKGLHPCRSAAVDAARAIGSGINERELASVHYYGLACPNQTSLAKVRREKTAFFNSGLTDQTSDESKKGNCTIGVPFHFVENYNIRMSSNVGLQQARTLAQYVRGRNMATKGYGIEGVEALTLPYLMRRASGEKNLLYEVACNLTNPRQGSVDDIKEAVDNWVGQQTPPSAAENVTSYFVDKMYRVGTTEKQCIDTLIKGYSDDDILSSQYWKDHDESVLDRFQQYLTGEQA